MILNHNHNQFNLIVACLGFEQLMIYLSFKTWIQIYFSVLGFEYSLKYGFVLLARILTRVWIQTLKINPIMTGGGGHYVPAEFSRPFFTKFFVKYYGLILSDFSYLGISWHMEKILGFYLVSK